MSRKIRLGNDIDITWSLLDKDEQPYIVEGRDFAVEIHIGKKRFKISNTEASGNSIHFIYYGKDQKVTGPATLVYIENGGRVDMVTFDTKDVFTMVEHSWLAVDSDEQPETVTLDVVTVLSNLESSIGPRGYSAYEIAVQNGYTGTEEEWLASLKPHITADADGNVYCDGVLLTDVIYSVVSAVTAGEQGRQEAETTRQTQETARQTAEGRRATAEEGRATAESGRVSAEQSRVAAETTRENRSSSDHQRAENDHSLAEQDHQATANAVLFTPQTLTEGEKAQARENIGVEGTGTDTEAVHFTPQSLTAEQKAQARTNIGATAPEIFWATYGVTTASQIDQAVADGKLVACYADYSAASSHLFVLTQTKNTLYWEFGCTEQSVSYYLRCNKTTNVWTQGRTFLESSSNKSQSVPTDRESTTKYPSVKAVFDSLGKWGIVSQTQTWTGGGVTTGYTYTMSNLVWGLIPQASIDLYEDAGAVFNATTGYFEMNGLTDLSYKEIQLAYRFTYGCNGKWTNIYQIPDLENARTTFPLSIGTSGTSSILRSFPYDLYYFTTLKNMEVLRLTQKPDRQLVLSTNSGYLFYAERNPLRKVIGALNVYNNNNSAWLQNYFFTTAYDLEELEIRELRGSIVLKYQRNFSLASVVYAVQYSANGATAITITLHPTAYARCQADATEYTYNGQTYTGIIALATAKNITIASA